MSNTPTPIADALRAGPSRGSYFAAIESVERLETELAAKEAAIANLREAISGIRTMLYGLSLDARQAEIAQRAIDRAKAAECAPICAEKPTL